jgi:hypothetical protein
MKQRRISQRIDAVPGHGTPYAQAPIEAGGGPEASGNSPCRACRTRRARLGLSS